VKPQIDRALLWVLVLIAVVTVIDIAAAALVRIYTEEVPAVAGDVSKVGIGALAGAAVAIYGNGHNGGKS
jgi:hypothetical protein